MSSIIDPKPTGQFTQEDIDFLTDLNSPERGTPLSRTAKEGYVRGLDRPVLQQLENIYKRVINPKFSLCFHCSEDRIKVTTELYGKLRPEQPEEETEVVTEPVVTEPVVTEPVVTEPVVTEPVDLEPLEPIEPAATEPAEPAEPAAAKNKGGRPRKS